MQVASGHLHINQIMSSSLNERTREVHERTREVHGIFRVGSLCSLLKKEYAISSSKLWNEARKSRSRTVSFLNPTPWPPLISGMACLKVVMVVRWSVIMKY